MASTGPSVFPLTRPAPIPFNTTRTMSSCSPTALSGGSVQDACQCLKRGEEVTSTARKKRSPVCSAGEKQGGLRATLEERKWGKMRMDPTDILDVTGAAYTFLINGRPPDATTETSLFSPGERVRLEIHQCIGGAPTSTCGSRLAPHGGPRPMDKTYDPVDSRRVPDRQCRDVRRCRAAEGGTQAYTVFAEES